MGCCCSSPEVVEDQHAEAVLHSLGLENLGLIGTGGSSRVFRVRKTQTGELLALKLIPKVVHEDGQAILMEPMFEAETQVLKLLKWNNGKGRPHRNVLELTHSSSSEHHFHILTKLYTGGEMYERIIANVGHFSERAVAHLARAMLAAMQHLHSQNLVHRDIKPENWVFESAEATSDLKLIDFGFAIMVEDDVIADDRAGTPEYSAPELRSTRVPLTGKVLKACDVWGVGVVVFTCLNGHLPFQLWELDAFAAGRGGLRPRFDQHTSKGARDFLRLVLRPDPATRATAQEALSHPWVANPDDNAATAPLPDTIAAALAGWTKHCKFKKAVARALVQHMAAEDRRDIKAAFDTLDRNRNGKLDVRELGGALDASFVGGDSETRDEQLQTMIEDVDEDGNGGIDQQEFGVMWGLGQLDQSSITGLKRAFDLFDRNQDGFVTGDDLCHFLHEHVEPGFVESIISEATRDGRLSFRHWLQLMRSDRGDDNTVFIDPDIASKLRAPGPGPMPGPAANPPSQPPSAAAGASSRAPGPAPPPAHARKAAVSNKAVSGLPGSATPKMTRQKKPPNTTLSRYPSVPGKQTKARLASGLAQPLLR